MLSVPIARIELLRAGKEMKMVATSTPTQPTHGAYQHLWAANTLDEFWQLLVAPSVTREEWRAAAKEVLTILPCSNRVRADYADEAMMYVLAEACTAKPWRLTKTKQLYYLLKPLIPRKVGVLLRKQYRRKQELAGVLDWPIEDRYVQFQWACVSTLLRNRAVSSAPYVAFWPDARQFALVLTHDVESAQGHAFVPHVADLEQRLGFRSAFNFVPERYRVDTGLLHDLKARGFEIGVHGLRHDGKLFSSRQVFHQRAARINEYLGTWEAVGFRAPYTHRHPEWMQALDIEYDLSFFDTDPYEPMPGGTMSIWPFMLGSFVELPYTLVQDHTLFAILNEHTPRIWLDKVAYLRRQRGMALVNSHPDYLRQHNQLDIYDAFLQSVRERADYWHALPREAARWWRQRTALRPCLIKGVWDVSGLPGAQLATIDVSANNSFASARPRTRYVS